jgi:hypothetical protein
MEWLTLVLGFLQPILLKCWDKTSSEDPQEYLRANFNSATGKMSREVVEDSIPSTRRAVRKARQESPRVERKNFPKYSREELYDLAEKGLIESMNAPPEVVAKARAVATGLPDED